MQLTAHLGRAIAARPLLTRWLMAGPGSIIAALLFTMAMPLWLPAGSAGVNGVAFAVILAPLIWAVAFVYAVAADNVVRAAAVIIGIGAVCGALVLVSLVRGL